MLALGLTAALAVTAATPDSRSVSPFVGIGLGPGISLDGDPASFQMLVRGGVDIPLEVENVSISAFLPVRMMTTGEERNGVRSSVLNISLVPSVRGNFHIAEVLRAYMDFGAGIAFFNRGVETFIGTASSSITTAEINAAFGIDYAVHRNIRLFVEPASFRFFTAGSGTARAGSFTVDVDQDAASIWTMMFGAHATF